LQPHETDHSNEIEQLGKAITALEAQRAILGDVVVDAALAPLRAKLFSLLETSSSGAPILEQTTADAGRMPAEQRKMVTILFADLAGFTAMSENLDPEDLRSIMDAYFHRWAACIDQYAGLVEKYIGDAVMAVFGISAAREDDPENAIRSALVMRSALEELNEGFERDFRVRLELRAGIHTGPVVVSLLGERKGQDFVVVGETVNLASRLQTAAPVGGILISHDTYRHVRGVFDVEKQPPLYVKGKREPLIAYLVLQAKPRAFRMVTRGVEGIETPMVGREAELERLQDALTTAIEDRERQLLTVVGEAGLGKSRLIDEFNNWLELMPQTVFYFKGRASPSMQNQAYSLLKDMFAFRFNIQEDDPPHVVRQKIDQGVAEIDQQHLRVEAKPSLTPLEIETRAHFIGRLLGYDFHESPRLEDGFGESGEVGRAQQFRDRALAYLSDYFKALAIQGPVVMLLEDLHWADESSLEVFAYLASYLSRLPVMILCAARPSLYERYPQWGVGQPFHVRLELQPLSRRDSRRLVEEILQKVGEVPEELRELVVANAEGNPFYIEELIKMFIEDGLILKDGERWQVDATRLAVVRVPPTLAGVLQSRFDSLKPDERLLLQRASVIGRTFWDQALAALSEQSESTTEQDPQTTNLQPIFSTLAALRAREMIYNRPESSFDQTQEYLFKHTLLRDVTYESVLKRQRRVYHAHAARWLEKVTQRSQRANEYAALIAEHYDRAGESQPALTWYRRAGELAAAHFANAEAVRLFNRCLELTPAGDHSARYDLLIDREKILDLQGFRPAQDQDLQALGSLVKELDDGSTGASRRRAEVLLRRSHFCEVQGDLQNAVVLAQQAIPEAQAAGDVRLEIAGYLMVSGGYWRKADYIAARLPSERALALAEATGIVGLKADALRNLGVIAEGLGDYAGARANFEEALLLKRSEGDRRGESMALNSLGIIAFSQQDFTSSRLYLEQSLKLRREIGDRRGENSTLHNLGLVAYFLGEPVEARAYFSQTLQISREIADGDGEFLALNALGGVAIYLGDHEGARALLHQASQLLDEFGDPQSKSDTYGFLSLLSHHLGDNQQALEYARRAVDQGEVVGTWNENVRPLIFMGHALSGLSRFSEAENAYQRALDFPNQPEGANLLLEAHAGMVRCRLAQGDIKSAMARAGQILETIKQRQDRSNGRLYAALESLDEPFRVLLTCFQALRVVGDPHAPGFLEAACMLLQERAAMIQDPHLRQLFLENVPANRDLLAEFKKETEIT
jgi:predicted ATPase/class 3 adenylate cyclase